MEENRKGRPGFGAALRGAAILVAVLAAAGFLGGGTRFGSGIRGASVPGLVMIAAAAVLALASGPLAGILPGREDRREARSLAVRAAALLLCAAGAVIAIYA